MKMTRAEKNEATTAALLRAAAEAFAVRGFEATTMDEIAERVGLSKGALYYRYRTKEDLFLALLDERCAAYAAQLDDLSSGGWEAFAAQFRDVVQEGAWPRLFFEFVSYASRHPGARRRLAKRTRALRRSLQRAIERQAAHHETELPVPAADIALAVNALANGLALERVADPRGVPDRAFFELPALVFAGALSGDRPGPA